MADTNEDPVAASRRALLAGVGVVGVAGSLAACGTASSTNSGGTTGGGGSTPTGAAGGGGNTSSDIAKTADIPVGSGKIIGSVVVTQPAAGEYKAFSAICTHQGCTVNKIASGEIHCPCHGSAFSITDGSVKNGPATQPLASKSVSVTNGEIRIT
ncbi:MAG TPA: Rieske (2Fe-2S) protein [Rugosimonospora sp.]|nr:Rieske (2Fe-2S) protein [Rugosimonospora sp.]